jgi:hypothetical protein
MAFYRIERWNGTIEISEFQNEEKIKEYIKGLPEDSKANYIEISKREAKLEKRMLAEERERKINGRLTQTLLRYNMGNEY